MRGRDYVTMNVYWFGLAFLWNGLHPIILPALLLTMVPDALKNTYLGGLTFAGLVLAMVVQPLSGALSDRTRSRYGRRRPWILGGTALSLVFLVVLARAGNFAWLLAGYLLLQLASNAAHGPAQGLIPDLVPPARRGLASGIKNLFDMGGLVVTSFVAGQLVTGSRPSAVFLVIGGVLAASALVTVLFTPETPDPEAPAAPAPQRPRDLLWADWGRYPAYARLIGGRFLVLLGIYAVQGFAQYYIRDSLGVSDAAAVTGNLLATIGLTLTLLVFPAGLLSDRFGRRQLNVLSSGLAAGGILLLLAARSVAALYVVGAVIGMAAGIFLSVNWALATDLVPSDQAGKYLGLSNLATAGAGAASRLAGPLIDAANALRPGEYLGYPLLFVLAAACALAGTLIMRRVGSPGPALQKSGE